MANIFESYFNEDEEKDQLLPSQKAAQEQKVESNIFSDYFKGEEYTTPKQEPIQVEQTAPKDERNILQKGVDFVKGVFKKKEAPLPDQQVMEVQGNGVTANDLYLGTVQSNKNLSSETEQTKEKILNKYVELVRKDPSLLNPSKRFSGDITGADVLLQNAKLALDPTEEGELRGILKQKLEENNYQMLSTNEIGMQNKEAKDLAKQYKNQVKTLRPLQRNNKRWD